MARARAGLRRKGDTWQLYVRVRPGPGGFISATRPRRPTLEEQEAWAAEQRQAYGDVDPDQGSFGADIETYLASHTALKIYPQRKAHLALWAKALGRDRPARTITGDEIARVMDGWLAAGAAAGTVLKRRTALQSFFGGKTASRNPVRGTPRPLVPDLEARAIDYLTIDKILAAMPDRLSAKRGTDRGPSLAKIVCTVLASTGLPPGILRAVRETDLQLTEGRVRITPRRKGKGVEARTLPLTPEGRTAFRQFHDAHAYGRFHVGPINVAFKRGAKRAGLDPASVHVYDLRHSFLTELYRATRDLATVARFALHAEGSPITARYAKGANVDVDVAAATTLSAALSRQRQLALKPVPPVQKRSQKLPGKVARIR
jgi:integrase